MLDTVCMENQYVSLFTIIFIINCNDKSENCYRILCDIVEHLTLSTGSL